MHIYAFELRVAIAALLLSLVAHSQSGQNRSISSKEPTGSKVQVVETTGDRSMLLQPQPEIVFSSGGNDTAGFVITVNERKKYQQVDGFGASLTDSSAWLVSNKLSPSQQQDLWQTLFSPSAGIGISFLRQPMGASDFSASGDYSYDDMPASSVDPSLANFSIAHDTEYITPLLARALAVNPSIKIVAVPWSPPAWMKTSGTANGGNMNPDYFPALARYFVKFVHAYRQRKIPIYAVLVQNEPFYSTSRYPSEHLSAAEESAFIAYHLGPALKSAGLGGTKILGYDHNWDKPEYPEALLKDKSSAKYLAGTAFHCYAGDVSAQSVVKAAYPKKDIWFTECSGTVGTSFAGDLAWNVENLLIGATRNWARSISLWNLVLDQASGPKNGGCQNCRAVVTVDTSGTPPTITYNIEYYVLGHLAKFVVPGAHRIDSNSGVHGGVEDVAFQNPDGSIVLLVFNSSKEAVRFRVRWNTKTFAYTLPENAVATFKWK